VLRLNSALNYGEWSTSRRGRFIPRKESPVPLSDRLGGPHEPVWTVLKINLLLLPGFKPRAV
jgi:hypothetical protein